MHETCFKNRGIDSAVCEMHPGDRGIELGLFFGSFDLPPFCLNLIVVGFF